MTFLWRHEPLISAPPCELILHYQHHEQNEIYEKAVFLLENDRYLYIRYCGLLDNDKSGVTDIEEFENFKEAEKVFNL